jgi:uncharacterized membrane protein
MSLSGDHSVPPAAGTPAPARPPFNEVSVLFPALTLYTAAYMGLMAADFFLEPGLNLPAGLMPVYIALLGAYAADKEIRRWVGAPEPPRKGSLFVYLWLGLFLLMAIVSAFHEDWPMPGDVTKVVLQVLGIFFGSKASKYVHERRQANPEAENVSASRQQQVLDLLRAKGSINRADVMAALGLASSSTHRLLAGMVDQGLIRAEGSGRGARYMLPNAPADVSR